MLGSSKAPVLLSVVLGLSLQLGAEETANTRSEFWAFQPPADTAPPAVKDAAWPLSPLDRFVLV